MNEEENRWELKSNKTVEEEGKKNGTPCFKSKRSNFLNIGL